MVWFAFSVQDQVEKYGAYVGIAAFFGLAVLSLLYFSQARELKRLREWAGRAPERARELEQRVVAQATATVARRAPAAPAATGTSTIAPPRRLAEMPAPPAAQTAAGAQATELAEAVDGEPATNGNVPVPPVGPGGTVPAGVPANGAVPADATQVAPPPEGAVATPNGVVPAAATEAAAAEATDTDAAGAAAPAAASPAAPSAPAAPDDTGDAPVPGEIPAAAPSVPRVTPAQRVGVTPRPQPLRQSAPSATPRGGGAGRRPAAPAGRRPGGAQPPREGRSAGTIALFVGIAVLLLGGGTWGLSQVLGGDDDTPPAQNETAPPPTATEDPGEGGGNGGGQAAQPSEPADTRVAVLNGTVSTGLAGTIADQLTTEGYVRDVVETNTDQTIQESTVYYADGERATAREVGKVLSIDNTEPLDPETESLAPEADIVVLAGADQAP
jgi:hypothetical protein